MNSPTYQSTNLPTPPLSSVRRAPLEQRIGLERLRAVLRAHGIGRLVHRDAGIVALRVQAVEAQAEVGLSLGVQQKLLDRVLRDALERGDRRVFRMRAAAHLF